MYRLLLVPVALCLFGFIATPAHAADLAGVDMADTVRIDDQTLTLNGLGLRKKAIFKVYVGGLYLAKQQSEPRAILASDTPRHMVMQFLRSVGADSISGAWQDCLAAQHANPPADLRHQFDQLASWMGDVENGDRLEFTYVPGSGTSVDVQGKNRGTVDGKPFADTLLSCWVGSSPPSADFKAGVLGQ